MTKQNRSLEDNVGNASEGSINEAENPGLSQSQTRVRAFYECLLEGVANKFYVGKSGNLYEITGISARRHPLIGDVYLSFSTKRYTRSGEYLGESGVEIGECLKDVEIPNFRPKIRENQGEGNDN